LAIIIIIITDLMQAAGSIFASCNVSHTMLQFVKLRCTYMYDKRQFNDGDYERRA